MLGVNLYYCCYALSIVKHRRFGGASLTSQPFPLWACTCAIKDLHTILYAHCLNNKRDTAAEYLLLE